MNKLKKIFIALFLVLSLGLVFLFTSISKLSAYSEYNLPYTSYEGYTLTQSYTTQSGTTGQNPVDNLPIYFIIDNFVYATSSHSPVNFGTFKVADETYYLMQYWSNNYDYLVLNKVAHVLNTSSIYLGGTNPNREYFGNFDKAFYSGNANFNANGNRGGYFYVPFKYNYQIIYDDYMTINTSEVDGIMFGEDFLYYANYFVIDNLKFNAYTTNDDVNYILKYIDSSGNELYNKPFNFNYYSDRGLNITMYFKGVIQASLEGTYFERGIVYSPTPIVIKESSFLDLFNSVINVPVIYMREFLSFQLFDVKVYNLFLTLLLFGLIVFFTIKLLRWVWK